MIPWQDITAIALAALAGSYLLGRSWQTWRGSGGGCGSCRGQSCDQRDDSNKQSLVTIESLEQSAHAKD